MREKKNRVPDNPKNSTKEKQTSIGNRQIDYWTGWLLD
jgi:hypothetical protein